MVILDDVKTYIGVGLGNSGFDNEILSLINATFSNFELLGLAPIAEVTDVSTETNE